MKLSFIGKIVLFSLFMLTNLLMSGVLSKVTSEKLEVQLKEVSTVKLPAIRQMTLLDMYHDGVRSFVYQSIVISGSSDQARIAEIRKDYDEMKKSISEVFQIVDALALQPNIKGSIDSVKTPMTDYVASADAVINVALAGKTEKAIQGLEKFDSSFEDVERILKLLGDHISSEAENASASGQELVNTAQRWSFYTMIGGLAIGILGSAVMVFDARRRLKVLLTSLSREAQQLSGSSGSVQNSAHQLSSATSQQSAAIEETVASMEEMSSMLAQTTQQSARAQEYSEEGQAEAAKGRAVMAKMASAMDEIQASNSKLDGMVRLIGEIKEKTTVINEIVSETRLLSFNASIEAARAGAHGKGFAVVAEEVGKLAAMSGKAAGDIRELLESSTAEVGQIVRDTQERVQTGKRISDECESMFNSMKESLEKIAKSTQMISAATKEQEIGVKQTNAAMADMSHATQSNSQSVEALSSQSSLLASGAQSLHHTVGLLNQTMLGGKLGTAEFSEASNQSMKPESKDDDTSVASGFENENVNVVSGEITTAKDSSASPKRSDSRWRRAV